MSAIHHEPVHAMAPERFASVLSPGEYEALLGLVEQAARELHGRVIWNVNSTAKGGGVVEMLRPLLGYCRGAAVDARWAVISGQSDFFAITKFPDNETAFRALGKIGALEYMKTETYPTEEVELFFKALV